MTVGLLPSLATGFLAELFRAYDHHRGGVHIDFIEGEAAEYAAAIVRLDLDVAFVAGTQPWQGREVTPLWTEQLFVALPDRHRLAGQCVLDWPSLAGEGVLIRQTAADPSSGDALTQRLMGVGHNIRLQPQGVGRDTLLPLVAMGRGLALVSEATVSIPFPEIVYRPLADETLTFSVLWSAKNDNPALRRLLSMARSLARSSLPPPAG
ncbi:LysR family substrate-binding domain-containing protein [Rhizobium rhizosphaerae]|uniref:LysR family substrate-binding domain-containing protein n=1 Tax=Xaviernesmea rhizosphaerae TaxID=1672749 RepID=UPI00111A5748|nr:LysR family substrate-binding domain-containing protein [Xaviernesmea rhizosphaerae]